MNDYSGAVVTDVTDAIVASLARLGINATVEMKDGMATVGNVTLPALTIMAKLANASKEEARELLKLPCT